MNKLRSYRAELTALFVWLATAAYLYSGALEWLRFDVFLAATGTFGVWLYLAIPRTADNPTARLGLALAVSIAGLAFMASLHLFGINPFPHWKYASAYLTAIFLLSLATEFILLPAGWQPWTALTGLCALQITQLALFIYYANVTSLESSHLVIGSWLVCFAILLFRNVLRGRRRGKRPQIFRQLTVSGVTITLRRGFVLITMLIVYIYGSAMASGAGMVGILAVAEYFHLPLIDRYAFARSVLKDKYIYADSLDVSVITEQAIRNKVSLLDTGRDKFSGIRDDPAWFALGKKTNCGEGELELGILAACGYDGSQAVVVRVLPGSGAHKAGIKSGDSLLAVNGKSAAKIVCGAEGMHDTPVKPGDVVPVSWAGADDTIRIADVTIDNKNGNSLVEHRFFEKSGQRIGYFSLVSFDEAAIPAVSDAFDDFQRRHINYLIIDLRYNGGGVLDFVTWLCNLIVPAEYNGAPLSYFTRNARYKSYDYDFFLGKDRSPLRLDCVVILTSPFTCSSSEMLIMSLDPFLPVLTMGEPTCGKPFSSEEYVYSGLGISLMSSHFHNSRHDTYGSSGVKTDYRLTESITFASSLEDDPIIQGAIDFLF